MGDFAVADVAIFGELHDNPLHHNAQARLVAEVQPRAIVFEMIPEALALSVTDDIRRDERRLATHLDWEGRGWPDFSMYWPIFVAAPEAAIFGAEVPQNDIQDAMATSASEAIGGWGELFGLADNVDAAEQAIREEEMAASHCGALPRELLPRMVEAQRLRDAGLARATLAALEETGGPVAVITGNGHARNDWGIPALLAEAAPELDVITLGQFEAEPEGPQPFDYWTVADAPERGDPCAAFR